MRRAEPCERRFDASRINAATGKSAESK